MYGCTYGNQDDFNEGLKSKIGGIVIINPDSLQSPLLLEYMEAENTDMFELLEDLKDREFVLRHAFLNEELSSFEFPNVNSMNGNIEISQK